MSPSDPLRMMAAGACRPGPRLLWSGALLSGLRTGGDGKWAGEYRLEAIVSGFAAQCRRLLRASDRPYCPARSGPAWPLLWRCAMRHVAAVTAAIWACGLGLPAVPACAKPVPRVAAPDPASRSPWAPFVAEAAARFALPEAWLMAILAAESGGNPAAVSPVGAMGLMQLMPATWRALSRAHGLGDDPFAPRANILAGAAYLRSLHDRYGSPGFLAAYNAGPGRYEAYLRSGRPLPAETMRYVARLASRLAVPGNVGAADPTMPEPHPALPDWRAAPLFSSPHQPAAAAAAMSPVTVDSDVGLPSAGLFPREWGSRQP